MLTRGSDTPILPKYYPPPRPSEGRKGTESMAKVSAIVKNNRRREKALRQKAKRDELRKKAIDPNVSLEEQEAARMKLQAMPRNASLTRVVSRCQISGRPKAVYRKFMLSRIVLREMAHQGLIPGMKKASW